MDLLLSDHTSFIWSYICLLFFSFFYLIIHLFSVHFYLIIHLFSILLFYLIMHLFSVLFYLIIHLFTVLLLDLRILIFCRKFWGYSLCQNSALIMTNGISKVRKGVDISNKINIDSCKFISEYGLVYNNLCSQQSIHRYHSAWCTTSQDSTFYVSIFLVSCKREGDKEERILPPLCTNILLFSK